MLDSIADVRGKNRESVGYKKPPIETRFTGQSGNTAGRPKSAPVLRRSEAQPSPRVDPTDEHKRAYAEVLAEKAVLKAREGDRSHEHESRRHTK